MLFSRPHTCPVHTSCSSSTSFLLLYSLSHEVQQCSCCLHNIIPVNIFASFCPLAGLFNFKGGLVGCLGLLLCFLRDRKTETASHQCSSPSKQLIVKPGEVIETLPCFLVFLDIWLSKQHISARYDTLYKLTTPLLEQSYRASHHKPPFLPLAFCRKTLGLLPPFPITAQKANP